MALSKKPADDASERSARAISATGTEARASAPAVALRSVSKRYASSTQDVLSDLDLRVRPGEFISLVGPSGCGKSTLLRLIAGLEPGHDGTIEIDGRAVHGPQAACGMLFQEHRLFPWLTVEQNVALGAVNEGLDGPTLTARVRDQLARVNLPDIADKFPAQLSGGMAQRVAIARLLMGSRGLLLLDEPFSALDAFTRIKLQNEMQNLWQTTGATMILVTHDIEEAAYLSDRIVVMAAHPGRIERIVDNPLPRPRNRVDPAFARLKATLFDLLDLSPAPLASDATLKKFLEV
ncbi:ABC transporter ATP-binding protein [Bordetella sp. LUAb4]|uniref:ABC transporter ATP-binding protein n=1 Tax=Bordetella sp. LUAb4 TaxID=2843195 RepID=UPI001E43B776|nr:ABC transporter ATP-binding protein [Bordetella sp. LUAb4]